MARTLLDSYFHGDKRVNHLAALARESHLMTKGRLTQIYDHCNSRWTDTLSKKEVNIQAEWIGEAAFAELMCEADLADRLENGYYRIKGIRKRLDSLEAHIAKSKKGGLERVNSAKRDKLGRLLPSGPPDEESHQPNASGTPASVQPVAGDHPAASSDLSLSLSLVLSPAENKNRSAGDRAPARESPPEAGSPVKTFITAYVNAYRVRYGPKARPESIDDDATVAAVRKFLQRRELARAIQLIQKYCAMDDDWFAKKGHDFKTFASSIDRVASALDAGGGKPVTAVTAAANYRDRAPAAAELEKSVHTLGFKPKYGTKETTRGP